ncbi:MAG: hypothetical protein ACRC80_16395 [Waterburya sp.]
MNVITSKKFYSDIKAKQKNLLDIFIMLKNIAKTASLLITLTILTSGASATAETEKLTSSCNQNLMSSNANSYVALSPNGDQSHCTDYYEKCDEYHCYECTVCDYGGPYCWEISENKQAPQSTDTLTASK